MTEKGLFVNGIYKLVKNRKTIINLRNNQSAYVYADCYKTVWTKIKKAVKLITAFTLKLTTTILEFNSLLRVKNYNALLMRNEHQFEHIPSIDN